MVLGEYRKRKEGHALGSWKIIIICNDHAAVFDVPIGAASGRELPRVSRLHLGARHASDGEEARQGRWTAAAAAAKATTSTSKGERCSCTCKAIAGRDQ